MDLQFLHHRKSDHYLSLQDNRLHNFPYLLWQQSMHHKNQADIRLSNLLLFVMSVHRGDRLQYLKN